MERERRLGELAFCCCLGWGFGGAFILAGLNNCESRLCVEARRCSLLSFSPVFLEQWNHRKLKEGKEEKKKKEASRGMPGIEKLGGI